MARFLLLPATLAAQVAAVVVLHRLGGVPSLRPGTIVAASAPPEDVLMAAARLAALAVAWWLLGTTSLCAVARACRLPAAVRALEPFTLPAMRRLAERSVAVTLSLSASAAALPALPALAGPVAVLAGGGSGAAASATDGIDAAASVVPPAVAGAPGSPPRATRALPGGGLGAGSRGSAPVQGAGLPGSDTGPAGSPVTASGGSAESAGLPSPVVTGSGLVVPPVVTVGGLVVPPLAARVAASDAGHTGPATHRQAAEPLPRTHRVVEGEHLWGIARAVVARATSAPSLEAVPVGEVAAYWTRLLAQNPSNLRSGDPDVVYPGETLVLPPLEG